MTLNHGELLDLLGQSQARLESTLNDLTDERARQPSLLPGWSRGHVATHLSRNADALHRLTLGVLAGEQAEMYPGGQDARNAAISEGAARPAALLAADHDFAGLRALATLRLLTDDLLDVPVRWRKPITARELVSLRWKEIEIHHVDLGLGYTAADWPPEFVAATLATELPALEETAGDVVLPDLPEHELLAWLVGRPTRTGLPEAPTWPF
jgi:maleylpyruvate isomerase